MAGCRSFGSHVHRFQTPEEIRHTRIVLVDEIMAHNAAVLG